MTQFCTGLCGLTKSRAQTGLTNDFLTEADLVCSTHLTTWPQVAKLVAVWCGYEGMRGIQADGPRVALRPALWDRTPAHSQ